MSGADAGRLARALGISVRTARLLCARGITDAAEAEAFLHPSAEMLCDPFAFSDMEKAVARIRQAIALNERICIYGDYDADGVCATAMLLLSLRRQGANVRYYIPSRHGEGYGMNIDAVERLKADGVSLIITVDNGIKANGELARCYALGMDAIVTDHHLPGDELPLCEALLCHTVEGCTYPNGDICGGGTAFKLIEALEGRAAALEYISLAGIATSADVVPLKGENRVFVALALQDINAGACPLGITALLEAAFAERRTVSARDISFTIAPRLNAAGRMEDASIAVELLTETDPARAKELAGRLNALNVARQQEESAIYADACAAIDGDDLTDKRTIVLKSSEWNPGVVGIAASKLAEKYFRPVVLLAQREGVLTGSARSIEGLDLHAALKENERFFTRFGGHAYAAGMTLLPENFDAFAAGFEQSVRAAAPGEVFLPAAGYEAEVPFMELTLHLAEELAMLAPFGEGNPTPVFRTDGVAIKRLKRMGKEGKHLQLTLEKNNQYEEGVWFYAGDRFDAINDYGRCDLLYTPIVDDYNGKHLQVKVQAIRPASVPDADKYLAARQEKFFDAISANIRYNNIHADAGFSLVEPDALILNEVNSGIAGMLVLCFTAPGAARFLRLAGEHGLYERMEVSFRKNTPQPAAYHAAVFAPVLDALTISRFRKVLVYDTPLTLGMLDALKTLAPRAQLFAAPSVEGDGAALMKAFRFDRARFVPLYKAIAKRGGSFYNRETLLDHLCRETREPRYIASIGADVCAELGFLQGGDGDSLAFAPPPDKRDLGESLSFRQACALFEMHEYAKDALRCHRAEA